MDSKIFNNLCELVRKFKLLIVSRIMIIRKAFKRLKDVKFQSRLLPKQGMATMMGNLFL